MRVRIANKKRFISSCIFLVVVFVCLTVIIHKCLARDKSVIQTENQIKDISLLTSYVSQYGGIIYDENGYFKRYIFQFIKSTKDTKFIDEDKYIEIGFNKDDLKNLNVKSAKNSKFENKDLIFENSKEGTLVKINKKFVKENYVFVNDKTIVVLISKKEEPYNKFKVVVDPGHGGVDKGTNTGNMYEKDLALRISQTLKQDLIYKGCKVFMTREDDKGVSLKERYDFANSKEADVFVSVHINSNKNAIYKGISTYYYDLNGVQRQERQKLANAIQKEIIKSDNWKDRETFRGNLAVLRGSTMPSALVECGFLTNYEDKNKLSKEIVLENFGLNISQGILNYLNANIKHE